MDREGCGIEDGRVRTAPGHRDAWTRYVENGWTTLGQPITHGGQPLPRAVWSAAEGIFDRCNPAFAMMPVPMMSSARLIAAWATDAIKDLWLPRIVAGECAATICISEPDAGSDVARIRPTARRDGGGAWVIDGEKCWISFGDHDLSPCILHWALGDLCAGGCRPLKARYFISFRLLLTYIAAALVGAVTAFTPGLRECSWCV